MFNCKKIRKTFNDKEKYLESTRVRETSQSEHRVKRNDPEATEVTAAMIFTQKSLRWRRGRLVSVGENATRRDLACMLLPRQTTERLPD